MQMSATAELRLEITKLEYVIGAILDVLADSDPVMERALRAELNATAEEADFSGPPGLAEGIRVTLASLKNRR